MCNVAKKKVWKKLESYSSWPIKTTQMRPFLKSKQWELLTTIWTPNGIPMPPWQAAPPQLCLHVSTVKVSKTKKGDVIVCQTFSGEFPKKYSGSWEGRYISGTYLDQWVKPITLHIQAWKSTSTFLSISLHRCRFGAAVERRWFELHLVLLQSRL